MVEEPNAEHVAMLNQEFVDEDTLFRILAVYWDNDLKSICVDYYDVEKAHKDGKHHGWFEECLENDRTDLINKYLNVSLVHEVQEWVELYQEGLMCAEADR